MCEYDGSGNLIEETVWLGDLPVATIRPNGSSVSVYYVHTDHLNTPKKVSRPSDNALVWRIDQDPFGTASANQNPSGIGTFIYNVRFPGQLYQSETGLNQNVNRDYDPQTGRYVESDPIGLKGGINPYAYAYQSPVQYVDPDGQIIIDLHSLGCVFLQIQVRIACKETPRRCEPGDSCNELKRKTVLHFTCALAQERLTTFCFPHDPTHQQRLTDALNGARRCLKLYSACAHCPAPPNLDAPSAPAQ